MNSPFMRDLLKGFIVGIIFSVIIISISVSVVVFTMPSEKKIASDYFYIHDSIQKVRGDACFKVFKTNEFTGFDDIIRCGESLSAVIERANSYNAMMTRTSGLSRPILFLRYRGRYEYIKQEYQEINVRDELVKVSESDR